MSETKPPSILRSTKAYACTCAPHQQPNCAYWRMGYCSDKWHGSDVPTPLRVINGGKSKLHVINGGKS